jgi:predicted nucleic acid-binding protein
MRSPFDVNVLIALLDREHLRRDVAHARWSANSAPGWAACPITQNGSTRIVAHPSYTERRHSPPTRGPLTDELHMKTPFTTGSG